VQSAVPFRRTVTIVAIGRPPAVAAHVALLSGEDAVRTRANDRFARARPRGVTVNP